jgi:hypothetical protein
MDNLQDKSITETHKEESSLIEQLIKPERNNEGIPYQLKRKKKKQHLRLH